MQSRLCLTRRGATAARHLQPLTPLAWQWRGTGAVVLRWKSGGVRLQPHQDAGAAEGLDAVAARPRPQGALAALAAQTKAYAELSKYRLSALVVSTASAGYLAAGGPVDMASFVGVCAGTALAAASANTFNQVIETNNDMRMKRTSARPLPSGRVSPPHALAWGVTAGAASAAVLWTFTNPLTTALGVSNIFLYAVPYTLSKTRSEANTWVGAVVGAIPPVMGWAAATGGVMAVEPLLLGSYLFLWQFPHFFALSWMYRTDYARGGFKMVPCADPSGLRTAALVEKYAAYMLPLPLAAAALGTTSWMFALEGVALNAVLMVKARRFSEDRSNANARDVFKASLWYLPAVLALFVFHSKNWAKQEAENGLAVAVAADGSSLEGQEGKGRLAELVAGAKRRLRAACVHDLLVSEEKAPAFCPPHVAAEAAGTVRDAAVVVTTAQQAAGRPLAAAAAAAAAAAVDQPPPAA